MGPEDGDRAEQDPAFERRLADARPDGDALTRSVLRARVTAALFGEAEPVVVGRYRLQRQLGVGGGGSVFVAVDPELRRDVAVKLIRYTSERHRERALAEACALAKLSHPNVVPVHDVGATDTHVYLVMELLRGASLRELAAGERTVRALVAAYRQAASGLAAAHAAGLVHRDFKPDNAMFGDDGRLRIVDFGLATENGDAAAVGTPRYMAPEQRTGAPTDATVDQYALGVSLREAIGEPPAWLGRVLAHATAERPGDRYPTMAALGAALADDPRARWRRRALIGAPIALAIVGFGLGRGATSSAETCAGGPEALASAWTPARVDAVVAHVAAIGTPFAAATAPLVRDKLGKLGTGWLSAHRRSCAAHERGELSDELYDRATVCLAVSRIGLGEAVQLLEGTANDQLDKAIGSLAVIERADRCVEPAVLAAEANPQPTPAMRVIDQQIEIAAIHARAVTAPSVALARNAVSAARTNGARQLLARALLVLGHAYISSGEVSRAIEPLHEALLLAVATGQDDVATESFARHAYAVGLRGAPADRPRALDGLELMREIGVRAGARGAFARALLSNNVAAVAASTRDYRGARSGLERAVQEATEVTGPGKVELLTAVSNLAALTLDPVERRGLYEAAIAEAEAAVGADHPETLDKKLQAAADGDDPRTVVAALAVLCTRMATLHPTLRDLVEAYTLELAWQATAIGTTAEARRAATLIGARDGEPSLARTLIGAYARLADGPPSPALLAALDARAAAEAAAIARDGWYQNLAAADAELALAAAVRAAGEWTRARSAAQLATRHLEAFRAVTGVPAGSIERRLAWARELATAGAR